MVATSESIPLPSRLEIAGKWCGWGLVVLGTLVITGWLFDIATLKSVLPGFISMKINTAAGFTLAGVSLLLLRRAPGYAALLASVVCLIGLLNLIQYIFGVNLGIDQLLVIDSSVSPFPGRLAPVTALDFTACGIGLMLLAYGRKVVLAQALAVCAAFSAFLAIIGYTFGVPLLYGSVRYTSMALHTGLGCLVLAVGLLCVRPREGIMQVLTSHGPGGWLARRLVPAMMLLPPLLGFVFMQLNAVLGDVRLTVALIVVSLVVLFLAVIWVFAHFLNDSESLLRRAVNETLETQKALSRSEVLLRQSQKMEAIGQLSAGIAHDFNNLLAVIIGYCELMLFRSNLTEGDRTKVQRIADAGETAAALTRQLLAFSRQQLIQPTALDLNEVVTRFEGVMRRLLKEDVEVVISLDPALGAIYADKGQIEQVLMNLAVNASDAMPDGGKLVIETANVDISSSEAVRAGIPLGKYVRLVVADSGVGMPAHVQAKIFEPFFTTKPVGKGTGLGLATVFGIMQQSHGGIVVQSEEKKGTAFTMYFPQVEAVPQRESAELPKSATKPGALIMVVEDAEAIAEIVRETLSSVGYDVVTAAHGAEALELCKQLNRPLDLVLTDVIMPEMGGRELMERLRKHCPATKVIFMSGYTNDVILRQGVLEANVGFLQKPFTPRQLMQKVSETLAVV
jgi:signal transduction histidine kinase